MSDKGKKFTFDSKERFLRKLKELVDSGTSPDAIITRTPFPVHEVENILKCKPGQVRIFALIGALMGFFLSFAFIIFTVLDWPLVVGGKPILSYPAFIIVAFECTILAGAIVSFLGFLHLSKLPNMKRIIDPAESGNLFIISLDGGSEKK